MTSHDSRFLRMVATEAVKASGRALKGCSMALQAALLPGTADPSPLAARAPLARWHMEVWMSTQPRHWPDDALTFKELVKAHGAAKLAWDEFHEGTGGKPPDPASAAMRAAELVGWQLTNWHTVTDADGQAMDLRYGTPKLLAKH